MIERTECPPKARGGRRPKRSGYRTEKTIELLLMHYGFRRVPMSGALGRFHHVLEGDLCRDATWPPRTIKALEVKRRISGCRELRKWLAQSEAVAGLVIETGGREEPLVVLPMSHFRLLLAEANYQNEPALGTTHLVRGQETR